MRLRTGNVVAKPEDEAACKNCRLHRSGLKFSPLQLQNLDNPPLSHLAAGKVSPEVSALNTGISRGRTSRGNLVLNLITKAQLW